MKKLAKHLENKPEQHMRDLEYKINRTRVQKESFPLKGSIRLGTHVKD